MNEMNERKVSAGVSRRSRTRRRRRRIQQQRIRERRIRIATLVGCVGIVLAVLLLTVFSRKDQTPSEGVIHAEATTTEAETTTTEAETAATEAESIAIDSESAEADAESAAIDSESMATEAESAATEAVHASDSFIANATALSFSSLSSSADALCQQAFRNLSVNRDNADKVTILGAGDNLIHASLIRDARTDGGYNFTKMYAKVKPFIEAADIATVNQETPLATAIDSPAGYPAFNTPTQDGDALLDAGFDVINHANNHIVDMGEAGIDATLDYWESKGVPVVGIYRSAEDRATIRIVEKNGIKVAFLGFLDLLNSKLPKNTPYKYTMLQWEDQVEEFVRKAKSEADIVVVHAHWGDENEFYQTELMLDMAQKMVNWGADVIFGNHPHVLQDLVMITREGTNKKFPVIYSMGNFLSGQTRRSQILSGLMQVTAYRDRSTGATEIDDISFLPTVTHYTGNRQNVRIYPLASYTDDLAASHGVHRYDSRKFNLSYLWETVENKIPEEFIQR